MRRGVSALSDSAKEKSQDFWKKVRPVSLKEQEISFITTQDSVREWESSIEFLERKDSIINHTDIWDVTLSGMQFINRKKGTNYYLGSLLQSIRPFQVGGYRQALVGSFSKKWTKANRLDVGGEINYGFRNRSIKGFADVSYTFQPKHFGSFSVRGGDDFAMLNQYESIQGTFSRSNYLQKLFYGIGGSYELLNGVMLSGDIDYATFRSIGQIELAPWSDRFFGELNIPEGFRGYQQLVADVLLTIIPFQKYEMTQHEKLLLGSKWPSFNIRYKKGIKPLGSSDVNYDFLELNVRQEIPLSTLGESKFELFTGSFLNDREIRIADNKFFRGSDRFFFSDPLRSFQYLGPTLNTTNTYFQGHYLHQFNGALMNKIPLIKKLKLTSLAGAGGLLLDDNNYCHTEIYAGLSKTFRIRTQLFKVTAVYVSSENSETGFDGGVKVGLYFYNSFTKKWSY